MKLKILAAITFILLATSTSAKASTEDSNLIRDIYGGVVDRTIIAGILIGNNETSGESSECEWS
ncbi:MAG: hypothetical protein ACKO2A_09685, partial [Acidimicrobiaceae bacterium]